MDNPGPFFVGVDVGTGSVRAAIFNARGKEIASAVRDTQTWRSNKDHRIFEQSTTDIWQGICLCVRSAMEQSAIPKESVKGIGFDATCSLAVTDSAGHPVSVTDGPNCGRPGERNIILWADHRAEEEAKLINSTGSLVLNYVGGVMSLEMEIPKILWLKNHMPFDDFLRCQFFDLPDYLTYRATASPIRSACSLVCKCSYIPETGWQSDFFKQIGLECLVESHYRQLGKDDVLTAGKPVGQGLSPTAAVELGLLEKTAVGSAVIDAYAGWIGTIGARHLHPENQALSSATSLEESRYRLAAVAGTSTCHLVQSPQGVFVPGVWGPYRDAIFPGWWMNEGGQSSTGQLIDFMIKSHPAYDKACQQAEMEGISIHEVLENELESQRVALKYDKISEITRHLHLYPDLHGNRSPIADPNMRGSIMGLTLDNGISDMARKYNATLEAISLQTRHIIEEMNLHGHEIRDIYMSGGQAANGRLMQLLANVCSLPVVLPHSHSIAVVLGSAVLGRYAAELNAALNNPMPPERLWEIMVEMTPPGTVVMPKATDRESRLLAAKYKIFVESIQIQTRWRGEVDQAYKVDESK